MSVNDIFIVPVKDKYLFYAPLYNLSALINLQAVQHIRQGLQNTQGQVADSIQPLLHQLTSVDTPLPAPRKGPLNTPLFLGIIPTRGCNMGCRYCDFVAPKRTSPTMSIPLARAAVDAYLKLLLESGTKQAKIHFFGGEPFYAAEVIDFSVNYAMMQTAVLGMTVHFEAITNGLFNNTRCQWIADHFNTIILSLDGPADIQNRHRPGINNQNLYNVIARSGKILSAGSVDLILRACVTNETVHRLPEIARWICEEFQPRAVCFESLTYTPLAEAAGLHPPDPWQFARQFNIAARILEPYGISTILSTADIGANRVTFCPVGQDALIVSPDGFVNACYLLEHDWQQQGLELQLGQVNVDERQFELDSNAIEQVRQLNVHQKPLCQTCLCRYHCAGGCHVNHNTALPAGHYDDLCRQTRLITISNLLNQLEQHDLVTAWYADEASLARSACQPTDQLADWSISA